MVKTVLVQCTLLLLHTSVTATEPFLKLPAKSQFPLLYFNSNSVLNLRLAARTTHRHITAKLKTARDDLMSNTKTALPPISQKMFSAKWNEIYGNNLPPLAFYYVLHPEDKALHDLLLVYMDRMTSYDSWYVASGPSDQVPVAHHLVGYATAFDFLWPVLGNKRRVIYSNKIINVTRHMFESFKEAWWGSAYLQNHVATNVVSIFIGSLVSSVYTKEAHAWRAQAFAYLERNMRTLSHIRDGSLDEGVGYTTYTFRSFSIYIYLAKRHRNVDHSGIAWLREHFAYYYHTVLPGFSESLGIADSPRDWFYGPESHLAFLDTFVLKNGSGNWLAEQIFNYRNHSVTSRSHKYTTLHTEFLWYNPALSPTPPIGYGSSAPHLFDDWGVFTYKSQMQNHDSKRTFLSFKSGYIGGKTVYHFANKLNSQTPRFIKGWESFNAGHEHPDQNSFTFYPLGKPFITENHYSAKFSQFNNIIIFAPSNESSCLAPFAGQLGDCGKWLKTQTKEQQMSRGKIIEHGVQEGIVYVTGEASSAYHPSLKLTGVYRALILLREDLLVVVDHVSRTYDSPVTHFSANFNNIFKGFSAFTHDSGLEGAYLGGTGGFSFLWTSARGQSPSANITNYKYETFPNFLSHLNITFPIRNSLSETVVYLFCSQENQVGNLRIKYLRQNSHKIYIQLRNGAKFVLEHFVHIEGMHHNFIVLDRSRKVKVHIPYIQVQSLVRGEVKNYYTYIGVACFILYGYIVYRFKIKMTQRCKQYKTLIIIMILCFILLLAVSTSVFNFIFLWIG